MDKRTKRPKGSLPAPLRLLGLVVRAVVGPPVRAVRGTARRVADPARQVVDYWRSERVTMRQSFVANLISSVTSLGAGLTLVGMDHRIEAVEGLFVLIPVSIGMRGNVFGALAARLGTSIHSGLFEVSSRREGLLFQNAFAAIILTFGTAALMGVLARSVTSLLGIDTVSVWDLTLVAFVAALLSSVVVLVVTIVIAVNSYRRGWDLDSVGAPLITTTGDVVTLPSLLVASYLVGLGLIGTLLGAIALLCGVAVTVVGWTTIRPLARRIVRESLPVLSIAMILDILAGTVVEPRIERVLVYPAFLIVIPGFLEKTGALGSILAARLGSKLHLGAVTPKAKPDPVALLDASIILALGFVSFAFIAVSTLFVAAFVNAAHPGALTFIGVVLLAGLIATLLAAIIGYYAATTTHRFGFDPDNHTIPLVTSGMDLLGVICLVIALVVFGVA
jgi:mgtE-like transporter